MIGRAPRKLGQRSYQLLRDLRARNERIMAADPVHNMRDAPDPTPGKYVGRPAPAGCSLLSDAALDLIMDKDEAQAA
jgi:hypothetical protein